MSLDAPAFQDLDHRRERLRPLAERLLNADGFDALAGLSAFLRELAAVDPDLIQQIHASIELRRVGASPRAGGTPGR